MAKPATCLFLGSGASWAIGGIPGQSDFLIHVLGLGTHREWIDSYGVTGGGNTIG